MSVDTIETPHRLSITRWQASNTLHRATVSRPIEVSIKSSATRAASMMWSFIMHT